jgi:DNA-directed RNA polymerase subunit RPC12/RpoP
MRLIDADELWRDVLKTRRTYFARADVKRVIDEALIVGEEPVEHGKWIIELDDFDCEYMECSCCGEEFYNGDNDTIDTLHNYCPNCGAKMDGEGYEN